MIEIEIEELAATAPAIRNVPRGPLVEETLERIIVWVIAASVKNSLAGAALASERSRVRMRERREGTAWRLRRLSEAAEVAKQWHDRSEFWRIPLRDAARPTSLASATRSEPIYRRFFGPSRIERLAAWLPALFPLVSTPRPLPMLRYLTAGESHGKALVALVDGFPAGVTIDTQPIDVELRRRQGGYGRGGRQRIETDTVEIKSGIWQDVTLGSPIALEVVNKDYKLERLDDLERPRPGHGDLTGAIKYLGSIRGMLERASARETAVRVAAGALAKQLLEAFGIRTFGYVVELGGIAIAPRPGTLDEQRALRDASEIYSLNPDQDDEIKALIDECGKEGDTLGGIVEVRVEGLPFGLGTHAQWDRKLDGRLAQAVMSVQAIKGVEIGLGFEAARRRGSQVHDPIQFDESQTRLAESRLRPADEQRRRAGGGHDQRPAARGPRGEETDQHAPQAARIDQSRNEAAGGGRLRAQRRLRGVGGQRDRRKRRGLRSGRGAGRQIRRRQPGRDEGEVRVVFENGAE